jgi:hypothetical protein
MVDLSLTISEIYGVNVRPLTSIISEMAEPIEFEFRQSLDYVDLYELPWSVGYISETVRDGPAQNRQHLLTFLKICMSGVDETLPDSCGGHLGKVRKKVTDRFPRYFRSKCDLNLSSEKFQKSISRERFDQLS